jgi:hypothetical protein
VKKPGFLGLKFEWNLSVNTTVGYTVARAGGLQRRTDFVQLGLKISCR